MGCTHRAGCPLFPMLNASLRGWRETYCDSTTGWQGCARYTLSRTGAPVPLALLPNGKYVQAIGAAAGSAPASRFAPAPRPGVVLGASAGSPVADRAVADRAVADRAVTTVEPTAEPAPARRGWWARLVAWLGGAA
jgi:hypothetical protein